MAHRIRLFALASMRLFLLASIVTGLFAAGIAAPTYAATSTITLVSGGGGAIGTTDPNTTYAIQGGVSGSAVIMTPNVAYASPIPGTQWVNTTGLNASDQGSFRTTNYSVTFSLPANFTTPSITVQVLADNAAMIYLNGNVIGGQPHIDTPANFQSVSTFTSNTAAYFVAGTNTLTIANTDYGGPNGVDFKVDVTFDRLLCSPGTYDNGSGCVPADPGYFVATAGAFEQTACAEGFYQPNSGSVSCIAAPAGFYVDTTAATQATPCPLGTYQPYSGANTCDLAPAGTYVDTTGATQAIPCPLGTYSPLLGAISCYQAPQGTYVDTAGATQATLCALGTYQPYTGQTSCTLASPGYFVDTLGSIAQTACPVGYTSEAGASSCYLINTAPTANAGGPYLGAVNTLIVFDGSGSSDPENDPLTYSWSYGDFSGGSAASHTYTAAGIYTVCLTVNDGSLDSAQSCTMAVVYDPSAGFVTGGGWFNSPAGAYTADTSLTGKATFGFVSKYKKGATVPTGNTEFQFQAGAFNFHSGTYEWLVVNQNGTNAQFKGSGTVNGSMAPNGNEYKFMLWAGDSSPDTFRIQIWWEDSLGNVNSVYDNGVNQAINGGSIVVHNK